MNKPKIEEKWRPRYSMYTSRLPPLEQPSDDNTFDINIDTLAFDTSMITAVRFYGGDDTFNPVIESVNSRTVGGLTRMDRMLKNTSILDPITIAPNAFGSFDVIQGRHRVVKAQLNGKKTIRAKF